MKRLRNNPSPFSPSIFFQQVCGNSMFPTLSNGDKILVRETPISSLRPLDIVLFKKDNLYISHRLIRIEEEAFYTKGDAVFKRREKINKDDIVGKIIGVHRKGRLRPLKLESTFLYYIFVTILSLSREIIHLYLCIERLYSVKRDKS